jgi:hypothetical protein
MPLRRPGPDRQWRSYSTIVARREEIISRSSLVDSSATGQFAALLSSHIGKRLHRTDISGSDRHFHRCAANRIYASILARESAPRDSSHYPCCMTFSNPLRLGPESSPQPIHNLLADGQPDPGTLKLFSTVQSLKDEFFSHVSHELRSPLTVIRQFVTILEDRLAGDLNPEQGQYLEVILRNVKQLQSMVDDLFEVTGIGAGKLRIDLESASVSEAVAYTVNSLQGAAKAKGITLSSDMQGELPAVYADPMRLRPLFLLITRSSLLRQTAPLRFTLVFSRRTQIAWFLKCRTPDAASVRKCASEFSNGCFKRKIRAQRGARVLASACTSAKSWLHERADKSGSRAPADKARYFQLHFQFSL